MTTPENASAEYKKQICEISHGGNILVVEPQAANAQVAIAAAITTIGKGIIYLSDGDYVFSASLTIPSGITLQGVPPTFANTGAANADVFESNKIYSSGTRLLGDGTGTYDGLVGNNTDKGSPDTDFGDTTINNVHLRDMAIEGFRKPVQFGAVNDMGLYGSSIENVWVTDNTDFLELHNFAHCRFEELYVYDNTTTQGGGILFRSSVASSVLIPGNSTIRQLSNHRVKRLHNGVHFIADAGAKLNEIVSSRIETLAFGEELLVSEITAVNASANLTFTTANEAEKYPVGIAIYFASTLYGFIAGRTYFVVAQDTGANTIQVQYERDGTGRPATGSGVVNLETGGFPNLTIAAEDALGISNCSFMETDMEGVTGGTGNGVGIILDNGLKVKVDIAGSSGVWKNEFCSRTTTNCKVTCSSTIVTDFGSGSTSMQYEGGLRGAITWYPGYGTWAGNTTGQSDGQSYAVGTTAISGTGATVDTAVGGVQNKSNGFAGDIKLTTGTGISTSGVICTCTWGASKLHSIVAITPLNAAAQALMPNIHQNYTVRGTGFDIVCDVNLSDSTDYIFGYLAS